MSPGKKKTTNEVNVEEEADAEAWSLALVFLIRLPHPIRPYLLYFITLYLGGTEREQTRQKPPGSGWVGARWNALANPKGGCGAKKESANN